MHAKSLQSCLTLCDPVDCSPPDSLVHGILQARILEWVAMSPSRESSWPRDQTHFSPSLLHWQAVSLPHFKLVNAAAAAAKLLQSCSILCHPMERSPQGSSVHGILQARILEWIAISSSRGSSHGIEPMSLTSPAFAGGFLSTNAIWEVLANFNYTKVLSIIIIMLYIRSSDLIYFITESL